MLKHRAGKRPLDFPARLDEETHFMFIQRFRKAKPPRKSLPFWLMLIFFSYGQASCTQDNTSTPGVSTTGESAIVAGSNSLAESTSHRADNTQTSLQKRAEFELIIGDTDNDGLLEEITICETNKICLLTPETGAKRLYENATWNTIDLLGVHDTDGEPGSEIVMAAYTREGQFACICIIHDKTKSIQFYKGQGWSSVRIEAIEDTDGMKGEEVILQARSDDGQILCLCLIRDRERSLREYSDLAWNTIQVKGVVDTDGEPGKEVIVESRNFAREVGCVCIIRDHQGDLKTYSDSRWQSGEITLITDTDGQPASDIVVAFVTGPDSGMSIIHDAVQSIETYLFTGKLSIQQVGDVDRIKGDEICVALPNSEKFVLVTDRLQEQKPVDACGEIAKSKFGA